MWVLYVVFAWILSQVAANSDENTIRLYAKSLTTRESIDIGSISVDEKSKAQFISSEKSFGEGEFCVGTADVAHHECFAVASGPSIATGVFVVQLDQLKHIGSISLQNDASTSSRVAVKSAKVVPAPNLKPSTKPPKPQPEIRRVKQTTTDSTGATVEVEVEVEEEPKSWIQKNWMYVVPPLLILFVVLGDDDKK
ncbi:hypothetical protein PSN45_002761 [Yamadazyma tenuis]|uniref:ER membrane protein complex subunit 10 n=1 Tax=Candida tenuis (strain ATCC 10573 / BCRC 21748 / CBS 615 / JCM 9827 / NBRC 10315 / NRRL Y-1498 / VKM Y-70) TaxID=590646 RepID=G3AWV6_CANTC|nr:uncharacterized protein CANTEDRAFT_112340 [Yamadazyma tenuis ATCC 10573]EGV66629.1 hypothetical protein CANTEDRAFT_112340 [Yamadazyma tenuis ATCC 10573]WEJ95248.1 hypothetical protein PSN45_002761 [Yamadazyma tenuis]